MELIDLSEAAESSTLSSPHPQHMGSAANSRRPSGVIMDPHGMNTGNMLPMDGIESHSDQFLRLDMGLAAGFVGQNPDAKLM